MHDPQRVRRPQPIQHLAHEVDDLGDAEPAAVLLDLAQGHAVDEFHGEIRVLAMHRKVVDGDDVGVGAPPGRLCLCLKARDVIGAVLAIQQVGVHQLDGDGAIDHRVMRFVDHPHGAAPER